MAHVFDDFSSDVEKDLAVLLGKITHHIHPDIVHYIADENLKYRGVFEKICHKKCVVDSFFYSKSDCVFPGYRRPINSEKMEKWKNNINDVDGTIFNDNTLPRNLWSFLAVNRAYSGGKKGSWASSGLDKFELAHIFAHKADERGLEKEVFLNENPMAEPYGMFTSASNVVLIPKGFAKPTDQMKNIKISFYKRHLELYGNNLIGLDDFDERQVPKWYDEIRWKIPDVPGNWNSRISKLLEYRIRHLEQKYQ